MQNNIVIILPISYIKNRKNIITDYLLKDELERLNGYFFENDKHRFALGRFILRRYISKISKIEVPEIQFCYNKFGKPYLEVLPSINFSISHSENFVTVALNNELIGIDIEYKRNSFSLPISDYVFSRNEILYLQNLNKTELLDEFYRIWTVKESFIKAIGLGLSYRPAQIDSTNLESYYYKELNFNITSIDIDQEYAMALCTLANNKKSIKLIFEKDFEQFINS
jgi:4'-phosphopantetheinyl transferase